MKRILAITSSPNTEGSVSDKSVDEFVGAWTAAAPQTEVARRDVGRNPL